MTVIEVDASAVHAPGTDLAAYQPQVIEEYRPRIIMAADEAAALDKSLRDMMRAVLREDVDFGVIPGTGSKPTLLKPGAEKLLQWFGFGHSTEKVETERDDDGSRLGVTYRCVITKAMQDGRNVIVATCEGYAGYDEDRFYVTAAQAEAKERANAQRYQRSPNPSKFAEYRAPWNSVIKMSQKRALVGAALQATSASTLFTQDLEDMRGDDGPTGEQFTTAAKALIEALPADTRAALVRWYRERQWAAPARWSAQQWCEALQEAGKLAALQDGAWLDAAIVKAMGDTLDKAGCLALWKESAERVHAGKLAKPDAARVQEYLRARLADLAEARVKATALEDDDPWAVKILAMTSREEAEGALAEIGGQLQSGVIDAARASQLTAAIEARFPAPQVARAA